MEGELEGKWRSGAAAAKVVPTQLMTVFLGRVSLAVLCWNEGWRGRRSGDAGRAGVFVLFPSFLLVILRWQ